MERHFRRVARNFRGVGGTFGLADCLEYVFVNERNLRIEHRWTTMQRFHRDREQNPRRRNHHGAQYPLRLFGRIHFQRRLVRLSRQSHPLCHANHRRPCSPLCRCFLVILFGVFLIRWEFIILEKREKKK